MKNVIILHGMPDKEEYYSSQYPSMSNSHWVPWLQKQLLIHDIAAATPEMPHAYLPDYAVWKREFERLDVTPETILVGHSCGGGFLIRWLSEHQDVSVGKGVLVAPWLDPDKELSTDFFDFDIDPRIASRVKEFVIFVSDNDEDTVPRSVKEITNRIKNVRVREFPGYGHFTLGDMKTEAFPELLEEVLN